MIAKALKVPEDESIESKTISNALENAQKRIEGHNFDIKKPVPIVKINNGVRINVNHHLTIKSKKVKRKDNNPKPRNSPTML